jgi:hypothetical protein
MRANTKVKFGIILISILYLAQSCSLEKNKWGASREVIEKSENCMSSKKVDSFVVG